jgi:hypothetical protein
MDVEDDLPPPPSAYSREADVFRKRRASDSDGTDADDERDFSAKRDAASGGLARTITAATVVVEPDDDTDTCVAEDELCDLMMSKARIRGHLLRECGHVELPKEYSIVHTAEAFAVVYNHSDNHLYTIGYSMHGGIYGADDPFIRLHGSFGIDLDDLPLFSSCGSLMPTESEAGINSGVVFGVCDNIGRVRVWDTSTGEMVLYFLCVRTPGQRKSAMITPNAFCLSTTHIVIATAPSSANTFLYYRPWDMRVTPLVDPVAFMKNGIDVDNELVRTTFASDGNECKLLLTKLTGIRCITNNTPRMPTLFWLVTHGGPASFNAMLPEFAISVIPSLDWPAYVSQEYSMSESVVYRDDKDCITKTVPVTQEDVDDHTRKASIIGVYVARFAEWTTSSKCITALHAMVRATKDAVSFADALIAVYLGATEMHRDDPVVVAILTHLATQMPASTALVVDEVIPPWMHAMLTKGVLHIFGETFAAENCVIPRQIMYPPESNSAWPDMCYAYIVSRGDHIVPSLDTPNNFTYYDAMANRSECRRAWMTIVHLGIADTYTSLTKDIKLVHDMITMKIPALKPIHRPTSMHVHESRTVCVVNNAIVWTDLGARIAAPVRVVNAIHAICLEHGAVVYCADRTLKFVEAPLIGVDCAVSTVFLRNDDGETTEKYRVTECVPPVSCLARINDTTVATHGFDNHLLFYQTINMEFDRSTSKIEAVADDASMLTDVSQKLYAPAQPSDMERERRHVHSESVVVGGLPLTPPDEEWDDLSGGPFFDHVGDGGAAALVEPEPEFFEGEEPVETYMVQDGEVRPDGTIFSPEPTPEALEDLETETTRYKWAMVPPEEGYDDGVVVHEAAVDFETDYKESLAKKVVPEVMEL